MTWYLGKEGVLLKAGKGPSVLSTEKELAYCTSLIFYGELRQDRTTLAIEVHLDGSALTNCHLQFI